MGTLADGGTGREETTATVDTARSRNDTGLDSTRARGEQRGKETSR